MGRWLSPSYQFHGPLKICAPHTAMFHSSSNMHQLSDPPPRDLMMDQAGLHVSTQSSTARVALRTVLNFSRHQSVNLWMETAGAASLGLSRLHTIKLEITSVDACSWKVRGECQLQIPYPAPHVSIAESLLVDYVNRSKVPLSGRRAGQD